MTNHAARLYALAGAVLVFFVAWAAIAARPWATSAAKQPDPRLAALTVREQRVRAEALAVKQVVDRRWAVYRARLVERKRAIAAVNAAIAQAKASQPASAAAAPSSTYTPSASTASAPSVRVVTLPPVTITKTS